MTYGTSATEFWVSKIQANKRKCYFQFKIFFTALTTTNTKRAVGDLRCAPKLICHQQRWTKQSADLKQKIISYALYSASDTITAIFNRIRLLGEITICFLMLVSPSKEINSNNTGRSFVAEKCTGSQGYLGIKVSLGSLPKTQWLLKPQQFFNI